MLLDIKDIRHSLDKAREMSEHYQLNCLDGHAEVKRVRELARLCIEYLQKDVRVVRLPADVVPESIWGGVILLANRYIIFTRADLDPERRRFVICKELFHVVLDDERFRQKDVQLHIEEVTTKFPVLNAELSLPAASEMLAQIAAVEFLFPFARRRVLLGNGEIDYAAIAARYRLPLVYVEQYLSDSYMENLAVFESAEA